MFLSSIRYYEASFKDVLSTKQKRERERGGGDEDGILILIYDTVFKVALFLFEIISSYILWFPL